MKDKIIVIEKGDLSMEAIEKLEAKGIIVIECKDPIKIKLLEMPISISNFSSDDFFMAALKGVNENDYSQKEFVTELYKRLNKPKTQ